MLLTDRQKTRLVLNSTRYLPRTARVAVGRALLERLDVGRASRADLLIIGHPKCGNTWLRTMISRLYQVRLGMPSDFTAKTDELAVRDPRAPRLLASNGYYSYEAALGRALEEGAPDNPVRHKAVVLLARNPGDVAVSWYLQFTKRESARKRELINAFIEHPVDRDSISMWDFVRHSDLGLPMLIDLLNTWERRVSGLPNGIIVRYEDLRANCVPELRRIVSLMGADFSDEELQAAADWTSFDRMKRMENEGQFRRGGVQLINPNDESTRKVRRGKVGGFRDDFSPEQVAELDELIATRLSPTFGYAKSE